MLSNFDRRHATRVYGIANPDERKGDHDDGCEPERIGKEVAETLLPVRRCLREGVEDNKETKDGKDEEGGEFGELGEADRYPGEENHFRGWLLEEPDKAIKGEKNEGGTPEVGRHIVVVSDDIGVKGVEGEDDEASQYSAKGTSPQEESESEEDGKNDDWEAREEENRISVVTGNLWPRAIDEHIAHEPLFIVTGLPGIGFERKVE